MSEGFKRAKGLEALTARPAPEQATHPKEDTFVKYPSRLIPAVTTFALGLGAALTTAQASTYVYIAAAKAQAIDSYRMDDATGALTALGSTDVGGTVAPMAVSSGGQFLYAGIRSQPFRVLTLAVDPASGALSQQAVAALPDNMAYLSLDPENHTLFASSYGGDKIAVLPVDADGKVTAGAQQVLPTGHNAHSIVTDTSGTHVYVSNLGSDQILEFQRDKATGKLSPATPNAVATPPGSGPRHLLVSPDGKVLYAVTELSGEVYVYAIEENTGRLVLKQSISALPKGSDLLPGLSPQAPKPATDQPRIWTADIRMPSDGKHLYVSERTKSLLTQFDVAADGTLTFVTTYPTETQPRAIGIDPTGHYLIATGEKSDHIAVYGIDAQTGALKQLGRYPVGAGANWVSFVSVK